MNEIIEKKLNELITPNDVDLLVKFDALEKRVKVVKDSLKQQLLTYIKENNLECEPIETERLTICYKPSYTRKSVDTEKLKDEGVYELYLKDVNVNESVSISVKYE